VKGPFLGVLMQQIFYLNIAVGLGASFSQEVGCNCCDCELAILLLIM
jgi:hypothetical protein